MRQPLAGPAGVWHRLAVRAEEAGLGGAGALAGSGDGAALLAERAYREGRRRRRLEGVKKKDKEGKGGGIKEEEEEEEEEEGGAVFIRDSITNEDPPNAHQSYHRPRPRFDERVEGKVGLTSKWWLRNHANFLTDTLIICLLTLVLYQ